MKQRDKYRLMKHCEEHGASFNGWTDKAVAEELSKELGFTVTASIIANVRRDLDNLWKPLNATRRSSTSGLEQRVEAHSARLDCLEFEIFHDLHGRLEKVEDALKSGKRLSSVK